MKNYCETCGTKLTLKQDKHDGLVSYCPKCEKVLYDTHHVAIINLIVNERNQVLLLKQNYINQRYYVLVSGYLNHRESLEDALRRETFEETNQIVQTIEYLTSVHYEKKGILMVAYASTVTAQEFNSSDEVDDIKWVSFNDAIKMMNPDSFGFQLLLQYIKQKGIADDGS